MKLNDTEPKPAQAPRAIFFDLGDTLLDIVSHDRERGLTGVLKFASPGALAGPLQNGSGAEQRLIADLAEYGRGLDERFEPLCVRHMLEYRQIDFHRLLYGRFGIEFSIDEDRLEWEYWDASLELRLAPGLEAALEACAARGIMMAVISNTTYRGWILEKELERLGVRGYFDFVMASAEFGIRKPDPLLFEIALRRMNVLPGDAWYIGNSTMVDCAGAAAAGMIPAWYAADDLKRGRFEAESKKVPPGTILLREWSQLSSLWGK